MRDPGEGVAPDGTITTGVGRENVPDPYLPLLADAMAAVTRDADDASVYLYGSVATGQARRRHSDVDLLAVELDRSAATAISTTLSARYRELCRGVELATASRDDFAGESDRAYGNRVYLRHYCVHLAGPDLAEGLPAFSADARAARGFNGDIAEHAVSWRQALRRGDEDPTGLGRRVARKTLLAAAGLVSIHDNTWTTDRELGAGRWGEINVDLASPLDDLLRWSDGTTAPDRREIEFMLDTAVERVTGAFRDRIGLWT